MTDHYLELEQEVLRLRASLTAVSAEKEKALRLSERCQEQMLSLLVMDLGYTHQPTHGHKPLRHQLAWMWAVEDWSDAKAKAQVESLIASAKEQDEYRREQMKDAEAELNWLEGAYNKLAADLAEVSRRLAQVEQEKKEILENVGGAMWAFVDFVKAQGHPFASWPDELKQAFSDAIVAPNQELTESEMKYAIELAKRYGWTQHR